MGGDESTSTAATGGDERARDLLYKARAQARGLKTGGDNSIEREREKEREREREPRLLTAATQLAVAAQSSGTYLSNRGRVP